MTDDADASESHVVDALYDAVSGVGTWEVAASAVLEASSAEAVELRAFGFHSTAQLNASSQRVPTEPRIEPGASSACGQLALRVVATLRSEHIARAVLAELQPHLDRIALLRRASTARLRADDLIIDETGTVVVCGPQVLAWLRRHGLLSRDAPPKVDPRLGSPSFEQAIDRIIRGTRESAAVVEVALGGEAARVERIYPAERAVAYLRHPWFRIAIETPQGEAKRDAEVLVACGVRRSDARLFIQSIRDVDAGTRRATRPGRRAAVRRALHAGKVRSVDELLFVADSLRSTRRMASEPSDEEEPS